MKLCSELFVDAGFQLVSTAPTRHRRGLTRLPFRASFFAGSYSELTLSPSQPSQILAVCHHDQPSNSFASCLVQDNFMMAAITVQRRHSIKKTSTLRVLRTPPRENPKLGYAGIHRSGFSSVSIHTVFDYHFGSIVMSHQAVKAVSKWTASFGDFIMGGQPPTFEDITTELEPLQRFTDILFEGDTKGRWRPKVREQLVTSLLLRYDQFCDILLSHPFKDKLVQDSHPDKEFEYDDPFSLTPPEHEYTSEAIKDNLFLGHIEQALTKADARSWFPK